MTILIENIDDPGKYNPYKLSEAEIEEKLASIVAGDPSEANSLFNSGLYKGFLVKNQFAFSLIEGINFLTTLKRVNEINFNTIHKGTGYYWIAIACYYMNNFETATYFFDAAVSEDLRQGHHPVNNPSPATRFAILDGTAREQAALDIVQRLENTFVQLIIDYNSRTNKNPILIDLDINSFRNKFLIPANIPGNENLRTASTTFISFGIEYDFKNSLFDVVPNRASFEPFFVHLFKGCLLFETLLKLNPTQVPTNNTLGRILNELSAQLGITHPVNISNLSFQDILDDIDSNDLGIETAILTTGKIRNTLGHNLGWTQTLTNSQYDILFRFITSSCFHVINSLYH